MHVRSCTSVSNVPMHKTPHSAAAVPLPTPPCNLLSPHPTPPAMPPLTTHNLPSTAVSTPLPTTPSHTCLLAPLWQSLLIGKGVASVCAPGQSLLLGCLSHQLLTQLPQARTKVCVVGGRSGGCDVAVRVVLTCLDVGRGAQVDRGRSALQHPRQTACSK